VSAALTVLPGIAAVAYDAQVDLFTVSFDPDRIRIEDIFAAVSVAGRRTGREYLPVAIP